MIEKKRFMLIILCLSVLCNTMLLSFEAFAKEANNERTLNNPFSDVQPGKWYTEAILYCKENGYMSGTSESTFSPDAAASRAMLVTTLWRIAGAETVGENQFADVPDSAWYKNAVNWAKQNGIAVGVSEKTFAPNSPISREQLAVMIQRFRAYLNLEVSGRSDLRYTRDVDMISGWAYDSVRWAVSNGLLAGKENYILDPKGVATRAELAQVLYKYMTLPPEEEECNNILEKNGIIVLLEVFVEPASEYNKSTIYLMVQGGDPESQIKITANVSSNGKTVEVDLLPSDDVNWKTSYAGLDDILIPGKTVDITLTFKIDGYKESISYRKIVEEIVITID